MRARRAFRPPATTAASNARALDSLFGARPSRTPIRTSMSSDDCPFLLYTVLSSFQSFVSEQHYLPPRCALMFVYGDLLPAGVRGWTRQQAEVSTPHADRRLRGRRRLQEPLPPTATATTCGGSDKRRR